MTWVLFAMVLRYQVKRTLGQFTPAQWDKDEWHPLLGPWRFIQVLSLCIVFLTVELNTFFLKFCLWIPPRNSVVIYRLILWWLLAIPTIREYNSYLQDRYSLLHLSCFPPTPTQKKSYFSVLHSVFNVDEWHWKYPTKILTFFPVIYSLWIFQKASEKGRSILLALSCHLHCGTSDLH